MRTTRSALAAVTAAATLVLTACGSGGAEAGDNTEGSGDGAFPITIEHAFGETVIEEKPERVATVAWGNHEAALALGVVPVIMEAATYGDDDDNGVLPWVEDKVEEMGAEMPDTYDYTDGIDFEAISAAEPEVILAGYSGITQEEYDTLSQIAPVVAYPDTPWGTTWQETIIQDAKGLGLEAEGQTLIEENEGILAEKVADLENLAGTSAMWAYADSQDASALGFFTVHDPRVQFLPEIGMEIPEAVEKASEGNEQFMGSESSETAADTFADVDVLIVAEDNEQKATLRDDPLLSKLPAVERDSIAWLPENAPEAAASNPSPLNIDTEYMDAYLQMLDDAASKAAQD